MLELRPSCEHCDKDLPAEAIDAMICSFECTFCSECVTSVLSNVCPNCGGGFCARPVRPANNLRNDNYLARYPASRTKRHKPIDPRQHGEFALAIKDISPQDR